MLRLTRPSRAAALSAGMIVLILLIALLLQLRGPAETPEAQIRQAWALAQASGSYRYQSQLEQTTYPAPSLANTGRGPRTNTMLLEGLVDQPNARLELALSPNGDPRQAIELRITDGRAEGRAAGGTWEQVERPTDLFAPGGDPLGFLAGMADPQLASIESAPAGIFAADGAAARQLRRYTFTLDGPALADALRPRLQEQLRRSGQLPNGLALDAAALYAQIEGSGELWVDADGLPARLVLRLDLPGQRGEQVHAVISTDYRSFDRAQLALASTRFFDHPAGWLGYRLSVHAAALRQLALGSAIVLAALGALLGLARSWRSRRVYVVTVSAVLASMLITPLLRARDVAAAVETQQAAQATSEAQRAKAEVRAQAEELQPEWNPHLPPQAAPAGPVAPASVQATTAITSTDTDGDGLSDGDEEGWGSCPSAASSSAACDSVSDSTDSDADGLSDGTEVNGLGTLPNTWDSDGDSITDTLEVEGFDYNGQRWYLNPNEADTNSDQLLDSIECAAWVPSSSTFDPGADCPDTDADGTPDVFDGDNDDDGVADAVDLSPSASGGQIFSDRTPLQFTIPSLTEDMPVFVDLQVRPTDTNHLGYVNSVLDWPSGDIEGQIERGNDSTFATTANLEARSSDSNAANGDVRIVPMLEITMPYAAGHYANLPVSSAYSQTTRTLGSAVDAWLDADALTPYGIAVQDADATSGELVAYVPLSVVADETGGGRVALSGRMLYRSTQSSWGSAQQVRLVWLVQMLVDSCTDASADPATCARTDELSVVNVYQDDWTLTGMTVSEERGMDVAIVYEDPDRDDDLSLDDQLWALSWNLGASFLRGRDCDSMLNGICQSDGARDVTIANLASSIDGWAGGAGSHDLAVSTFSYVSQDYATQIAMTETTSLLSSDFSDHTDLTPTFLFAKEIATRSLNLEQATTSGASVTLSMSEASAPLELSASLSWASYQHVDGAWQNYDAEAYLDTLSTRLTDDSFFQPADGSETSQDDVEGKLIWAQSYYTALSSGVASTVEQDAELTWQTSITVPETSYGTTWPPSTSTGFTYLGFAYLEVIKAAAPHIFSPGASFWQQLKHAYAQGMSAYTFQLEKVFHSGAFTTGTSVLVGLVTAVAVAGAVVFAVGYLSGDSELLTVGVYILSAVTAVTVTLYLANMVYTAYLLHKATTTLTILTLGARLGSFKAVGAVGLIMAVAVAWGMFFYQWATGQITPGTIAFDMALAQAIAATIVSLIFFILDATIIGRVVTLLIYLIDAILTLAGEKGIQQWLTEQIAEELYDIDFMITNLSSSDRLSYAMTGLTLRDSEAGFVESNAVTLSMEVTTTLTYDSEFSVGEARRSTFRYQLQQEAHDITTGLGQSAMAAAWTGIGGRQIRAITPVSYNIELSDYDPGLNQTSTLYLTEGFNAPYKGCWQTFGIDVSCTWEDFINANHLEIGQYLTFDVLPNTLTEFYTLAWNQNPDLPFPSQTDHDGDGLLSIGQGGSDPDDTSFDTDGDGLSDAYEQAIGTDDERPDSDADGLTDQAEAALGTDPRAADSDGDTLNDYLEARQGWLVDYGAGITRVWSDPTIANADDDALTDLQEYVFGFNPWVATDPSLIDDLIQFDTIGIAEDDAPALLARFEEAEGATSFVDSSGADQGLSCAGSACPTAGTTGRYGSALTFDGANDYLEASTSASPSTGVTLAAWVRLSNAASNQKIVGKGQSFLLGVAGGTLVPEIWDTTGTNYSLAVGNVPSNTWTHLAVTWQSGGQMLAYINGVQAGSRSASSLDIRSTASPLRVGVAPWDLNAFRVAGALDEVAVFERALTASEVSALMEGRYNPNDLLLAPGTNLTYEATITNTLTTREANGHMTASSTAVEPAIAAPDVALRFEDQDRVLRFINSNGESSAGSCAGSTCPSSVLDSGEDLSLDFDGVDDMMSLPQLTDTVPPDSDGLHTLSFALKVDSLPASGETAHIFSTDRTSTGALNIYLDSTGKLYFATQGSVSEEYWHYTNGSLTSIDPWVGYGYHVSTFAFSGANLGVWETVNFEHQYFGSATTDGRTRLKINGVQDSIVDYTSWPGALIGPGQLGSDSAGSSPLDGGIDDLATESYALDFNTATSYDGSTFFNSYGAPVTCASAASCPTTQFSGASGESVRFDGLNDQLPLNTALNFSGNNNQIGFWLKLSALPTTRTYLLDSTCGTGQRCADLYIDAAGKLVLEINNTATSFTSSGTITAGDLNTWIYVKLLISVGTTSSPQSIVQFYLRGSFDVTRTTTNMIWPLVIAPALLGNDQSGAYPLNGSLDDVSVGGGYNLNFNVPDFAAHEISRVTEASAAACANPVTCPSIIEDGAFGAARSFDGIDDELTLGRHIASDFTIAFWMRSPQATSTASHWWGGKGLVDGEVSGSTNDLGVALGDGGKIMFGVGSPSGDTTIKGGDVDDGQWHHVVATRIQATGALALYVDGALIASGTGSTATLNAPPELRLGMLQTGLNPYSGALDELLIIPAAVDVQGVQALMSGTYPAIEIASNFTTFTVAARSAATTTDGAEVSEHITSGQHRFDQEVEAAIDLEESLSYTVVDSNLSDLLIFTPFEDVPGANTFVNIGNVSGWISQGYDADLVCEEHACPVAGLRGQTGRSAYFDGVDDTLGFDSDYCCASGAQTVVAWVKADRGTIIDTRYHNAGGFHDGFQLDFNRLQIVVDNDVNGGGSYATYNLDIELPENEWSFVAATVDLPNWEAKVYVNGALVATQAIDHPDTQSHISPVIPTIGSNSDGGSDFLHGYLDELRVYDIVLTQSQIAALYTQSAPQLNFEFDEERSASAFVDSSINGYDGIPSSTTCAQVTLASLSASALASSPGTLTVASGGDVLASVQAATVGSTAPLTSSAQLCTGDTLTVSVVNGDGSSTALASQQVSVTTPGAASASFSGGGTNVTLSWSVADELSYRSNPTPGTDGKIGNTALFDGAGVIKVDDATAIDNLSSTLTIVGWIKPGNMTSTDHQMLLSHGIDNSANGFGFGVRQKELWFTNFSATLPSGPVLDGSVWQHIAAVYDSTTQTLKFYVDGVLIRTVSGPPITALTVNSDDPLYIGGRASSSGVLGNFYTGQLDELAVYSRALTASELYALYLRDLRWYRDRTSAYLIVDTDEPSIELLSSATYRANAAGQLALAAVDPTTSVRLVDVGIKGPNASSISWSSAPVCAEALDSNAAWCPSFDPTALGGAGAYQLQFRAVDAVGHQTTSPATTIYVDGTAPTAASSYSQTRRSLTVAGRLAWTLDLSGTVNDPALPGSIAGSGIEAETVRVQLLDAAGAVVTDGPQAATVSGNTWSLSYRLTGKKPAGRYTVQVLAEDAVGNASTTSVGTIILDGRGPSIDTMTSTLPSTMITSSTTLSGTLSEQAEWIGEVAKFHFEETSGSSFADSSGGENSASCSTCPTSAGGGPFGSARLFDGGAAITLSNEGTFDLNVVTVAAWVKVNSFSSSWQAIVTKGDGAWRLHRYGNTNLVAFSTSGLSNTDLASTVSINDGEWHHLVGVYDGSKKYLYIDGKLNTAIAVTGTLSTNNYPVQIGANAQMAGRGFNGMLDEVAIYERALSQSEIYALAQKDGSGLAGAGIWLEEYHFEGSADPESWQAAILASSGDSLSTWQYALPGSMEGFYRIHVRGADAEENTSSEQIVWSGSIDMIAPRLTFTATLIGSGAAAETAYTYRIDDLFLDTATLTARCPASEISLGYDAESGRLNSAEATCRVAGHHAAAVSITACDVAGHCTTQTVTPTAGDGRNIVILSPADGASTLASVPISITGAASAPAGIASIAVRANGAPIGTIAGNGAATLDWALGWIPPAGTYTVTALLTDQAGTTREDTIVYTVDSAFSLMVSIEGTGTGAITSAPAGISCGNTCTAIFAADSVITLTATADADSTFAGWSGACSGIDTTCQLTQDQPRSVTATFSAAEVQQQVFLPLLRR